MLNRILAAALALTALQSPTSETRLGGSTTVLAGR